jgi:hypothetical protein
MMSASFEYYRNVLTDAEQNKPSRLKMSTLALGGEKGVGANLCNGLKSHADNLEGGVTSRKGTLLAGRMSRGTVKAHSRLLSRQRVKPNQRRPLKETVVEDKFSSAIIHLVDLGSRHAADRMYEMDE